MKKILALLAVVILVLGLAACGGKQTPETTVPAPVTEPTTVPTEPTTVPTTAPTEPVASPVIGGVDLTGMSLEDAAAALNEAAADYKLALNVNGTTADFTAEELGLKLDMDALAEHIEDMADGNWETRAVFTYDRTAMQSMLKEKLNDAPKNATVSYSGGQGKFIAVPGSNGTEYDLDAVLVVIDDILVTLAPQTVYDVEVSSTSVAPELTADSDKVKSAVNTANGYLKLSLTYTFTPDGGSTAKESIGVSTIATFVKVSENMEVSVSKSAIESYAGKLADRHNGADYKGTFKNTGMTVTYYGQRVNKSALADDIYSCVTSSTSGTRTAPYSAKSDLPYGGSFVEVDLTNQKLYLYKNGERILSTSLVSGSVAEGHRTPTGVYSIYAKQTDRYLTGADYRSFVHYWMPFLGGYGLHDASWRGSFGGTIYYYDGSHGCVNLPSSAAKTIYNNVSVGTKVILYGGKREVPNLEQKLTGTTSYTVKEGDKAFKLAVQAKFSKGVTLTYVSSDTNVVTVSSNGTVTVKGPGTATITVTAAPFEFYTGAELKVTIAVQGSGSTQPTEPQPTEPSPTEPKPTEPAPTEPAPTEPEPSEPAPVTEPAE